MPRTYFTFGDIEGKLDVLGVECTKCERKGRYSVANLIAKHGRRGNMSAWVRDLKGDCPRRDAHSLHDRCDRRCCRWRAGRLSAPPGRGTKITSGAGTIGPHRALSN
jgi:hypothetical protein